MVKTKRWCFNCLGSRHVIKDCTSKSHCLNCGQTHHTLLHFGITAPPINQLHQDQSSSLPPVGDNLPQNQASSAFTNIKPSTHSQCQPSNMNTTILLSTALIEVLDARGDYQQIRALLDSGSQINIISQSCCNRLGLYNQNHNISLSIQGINDMNSSASKAVSLQIRPCTSPKPLIKLNAIVMPKVCNKMPSHDLNVTSWSHLSNLKLADPHFNISNEIDLLLGAEIFSLILNSGRRPGKHNEPNAFHTIFGWILMGSIPNPSSSELLTSLHCSCNPNLDSTLKRFWELEEVPRICKSSPEDSVCEDIFSKTVSRTASGRYIVSLPFRANAPIFSNSLELALRRFHLLELKLNRNPSLKEQYSEFMRDYLSQHHMSPITETYNNADEYFIPHHCVLRPESATTKLRVVFDASAKTTSGVSLNDTLLIGPKLQSDLVTLLLSFRINPIALMVDIRQMYRQILLSIQHRKYQKILWRFSPNEPVQKYVLNTVTYGVSSAPFLAIRTLLQLAQDEGEEFPLAVKAIKTSSYVDDIVTSCQSVQEAQSLKSQLISLLRRGGFELHKWKSNHTSLLAQEVSDNSTSLDLNNDSTVKVLGLQWNASADHFSFTICSKSVPCSKRNILSEIARIFDPLGFLSPLTLFAKMLIQHLWTLGIGWDENPPSEVTCIWNRIKDELPILSNISVPRFLFHTSSFSCTLHGFADASEHGYAAVIYCRYETMDDICVSLICAKSKVSPLKTLSIPKLELSAACLLADLLFFVIKIFDKQIPVSNIFAWSDSSTTLSWIRSSPHKWKTFVSNRVSRIQDKLSPEVWHYVPSKDNPADCASRGLFPSQLIDHSQWWAGPSWLRQPSTFWPSMVSSAELDAEYLLEEKRTVLSTQRESNFLDILLEKYSSFTKIQRIVAYVKRFLHNCQLPPSERKLSYLTFEDLHHASLSLVKHIQSHVFHSEISSLLSGKVLEKSLRKLNLFLDTNGLLRVGGRLTHSKLTYDKRHPLLLPSKHRLTDLIIESVHCQYFHPGFQTLYFLLLQKYWILSAKRTIRKKLSKCLTCWKQNPIPSRAPMGNLPPLRVSQIKPFSCIGIDFGGPYSITLGRHRGAKTHNAYICLFVCFATKALHLELATDLTSETFLAALRRLIARRGRVTKIFSDNGTNFIGASRILKGFHIAAQQELIEWSFIPPSSPHFGGLWEAGIKSVKNHISRVLGKQLLTYEEFNTLLVQVESVLNSRPLCPISSDPNDLSVLTPGHFLTLEPLNASPDEELGKVTLNRLSRWQLIQHLHKDFWSRWSKEYLHTLFQRGKWTDPTVNIELGTMVLIKHDSMPPSRWQLGCVVEVYPGTDGIIRVASVKTPTGLLKRSVVKLCPLPLENNQ
ncbi:uncharacterized protein [Leptinotarsa decemlineata]|uniref:uncharacterized protein n=1 Tax=Leptinotarsa decemlineata TaxID=7539 RepID=UPI003D3085C1